MTLAGDLEVFAEASPITATLRAASSCTLLTHTRAVDVRPSFAPDARVGLDLTGRSDEGTAQVGIAEGRPAPPAAPRSRAEVGARSPGYQGRPVRVEVRAARTRGNVTVASLN